MGNKISSAKSVNPLPSDTKGEVLATSRQQRFVIRRFTIVRFRDLRVSEQDSREFQKNLLSILEGYLRQSKLKILPDTILPDAKGAMRIKRDLTKRDLIRRDLLEKNHLSPSGLPQTPKQPKVPSNNDGARGIHKHTSSALRPMHAAHQTPLNKKYSSADQTPLSASNEEGLIIASLDASRYYSLESIPLLWPFRKNSYRAARREVDFFYLTDPSMLRRLRKDKMLVAISGNAFLFDVLLQVARAGGRVAFLGFSEDEQRKIRDNFNRSLFAPDASTAIESSPLFYFLSDLQFIRRSKQDFEIFFKKTCPHLVIFTDTLAKTYAIKQFRNFPGIAIWLDDKQRQYLAKSYHGDVSDLRRAFSAKDETHSSSFPTRSLMTSPRAYRPPSRFLNKVGRGIKRAMVFVAVTAFKIVGVGILLLPFQLLRGVNKLFLFYQLHVTLKKLSQSKVS